MKKYSYKHARKSWGSEKAFNPLTAEFLQWSNTPLRGFLNELSSHLFVFNINIVTDISGGFAVVLNGAS